MAKDMQEIAALLQGMRFRKKLFGVDEADVWRQLEALHREYQAAYDAQGDSYRALLQERDEAVARLMRRQPKGDGPHG